MWAIATLFHQLGFRRVAETPLETVVSAVALWVLARPNSRVAFTALLSMQIAEIAVRAPVVSNHWWTTAFVALVVLTARISSDREASVSATVARAAPALRWILLAVYFWGVFHKLNRDFLDPQLSCGVELYTALRRDYLPWLPDGGGPRAFAMYGTLIVETAIPLLLIFRRSRAFGILLGVGFHFFLGFVPYSVYYNFSSMLFVLYFLFATPGWFETGLRRLEQRRATAWIARAWAAHRRRPWVVVVAIAAFCVASALGDSAQRDTWRFLPRIPWTLYGGGLLLVFAANFGRTPNPSELEHARRFVRFRGAPWVAYVLAGLYWLNGASPYLGLKTETSLAMYSNLRTEAGRSNHYLVAEPLDLFGWQNDIVHVRKTADPKLRGQTRGGFALTWFEFRDRVARTPGQAISYEREQIPAGGGEAAKAERGVLDDSKSDPRFREPEPMWRRKLVYFRPVDMRDRQRCLH